MEYAYLLAAGKETLLQKSNTLVLQNEHTWDQCCLTTDLSIHLRPSILDW